MSVLAVSYVVRAFWGGIQAESLAICADLDVFLIKLVDVMCVSVECARQVVDAG